MYCSYCLFRTPKQTSLKADESYLSAGEIVQVGLLGLGQPGSVRPLATVHGGQAQLPDGGAASTAVGKLRPVLQITGGSRLVSRQPPDPVRRPRPHGHWGHLPQLRGAATAVPELRAGWVCGVCVEGGGGCIREEFKEGRSFKEEMDCY